MTVRGLIAELDPERDYGELTYEDVVNRIELGEITIMPGYDLPVLKGQDGKSIKGTGRAKNQTSPDLVGALREVRQNQGNRDWFDEAMQAEHVLAPGKTLRQALLDEAVGRVMARDPGSAKILLQMLEQHIGKPKETTSNTLTVLAARVMEVMAEDVPMVVEGDYTLLESGKDGD